MLIYMYCVKLDHAQYLINYDNTHRNFKPYPAIGNEGVPQGRIQAFVREGAKIAREARGKIRPRPLSMTTPTKTAVNEHKRLQ